MTTQLTIKNHYTQQPIEWIEQINWGNGYIDFFHWPKRFYPSPLQYTVAIFKVKIKTKQNA